MADTPLTMATAKATFDSLTQDMRPRVLVDNIFVDKPFWVKMRGNMLPVSGRAWMPPVMLRKLTGQWYTRAGEIGSSLSTSFSPEIASSAKYEIKFWAGHVLIPTQDIAQQGRLGLVDLHQAYIDNEVLSVRDAMSTAIFDRDTTTIGTGQESNGIETLDQACWYGNTYGGISPLVANQTTWEAHVMYGETDTYIQPVAPSVENFEFMVDTIEATSGEKPDLIVVTEATWLALKAQVTANEYLSAMMSQKGNEGVNWQTSTLWIGGVPVVRDRDCYGEDFTADQATVVLADGHDAYFLNFNRFKFAYDAGISFRWHEDGWERTKLPYDAFLNTFYVWGTTGSTARRTLGRIANIDPTMNQSDFTLGTIRLPGGSTVP